MKLDILKKMQALEGDKEAEEAVEKAKTPEELAAYLNSRGIEVTAEDFLDDSKDELSESDLEDVAGGLTIFGYKIGFFSGFGDGMSSNQCGYNGKAGFFYKLGYKCAGWINGNCW